jgi:hypothetical protein
MKLMKHSLAVAAIAYETDIHPPSGDRIRNRHSPAVAAIADEHHKTFTRRPAIAHETDIHPFPRQSHMN